MDRRLCPMPLLKLTKDCRHAPRRFGLRLTHLQQAKGNFFFHSWEDDLMVGVLEKDAHSADGAAAVPGHVDPAKEVLPDPLRPTMPIREASDLRLTSRSTGVPAGV